MGGISNKPFRTRDGRLHPGDTYGPNGWETRYRGREPRVFHVLAPFVILFCVGVVLTMLALILAGRV